MLHFTKKNVTPPGGYKFVDPDSEQSFDESNMQKLVRKVALHRKSNNLEPIDNLESVIEDWICQRMPLGICQNEAGHSVSRVRYRTAENSIRVTMAIHKYAKKLGRGIVSRKEAELRAGICVVCRLNVPFAGCMSCRGVRSIIDGMKRGQNIGPDKQLLSCAVCGVINEIHVWIDNETISDTTHKISDYPETCWKRNIIKEAPREHRYQADITPTQRRNSSHRKPVLRTRRPRVENHRKRNRPERKRCCGKSRKRKAS